MPTITPVAPPPTGAARPAPEAETANSLAKPQARESKTAEAQAKVAPVEATERAALPAPQPEARARLTIDYDKEASRYIYRLVDPVTREVFREIPSEEALKRIRYLRETAGLKVDKQL